MSESVKVGGIGKNPAIDKINHLNGIDVKNYAVDRMEQLFSFIVQRLRSDFMNRIRYAINTHLIM